MEASEGTHRPKRNLLGRLPAYTRACAKFPQKSNPLCDMAQTGFFDSSPQTRLILWSFSNFPEFPAMAQNVLSPCGEGEKHGGKRQLRTTENLANPRRY
jgi:hypothetical protein